MPRSSFYEECYCSLLNVRPHPVTSRAEWSRHRATQEQDRLDELFSEPSSTPEPQNKPWEQKIERDYDRSSEDEVEVLPENLISSASESGLLEEARSEHHITSGESSGGSIQGSAKESEGFSTSSEEGSDRISDLAYKERLHEEPPSPSRGNSDEDLSHGYIAELEIAELEIDPSSDEEPRLPAEELSSDQDSGSNKTDSAKRLQRFSTSSKGSSSSVPPAPVDIYDDPPSSTDGQLHLPLMVNNVLEYPSSSPPGVYSKTRSSQTLPSSERNISHPSVEPDAQVDSESVNPRNGPSEEPISVMIDDNARARDLGSPHDEIEADILQLDEPYLSSVYDENIYGSDMEQASGDEEIGDDEQRENNVGQMKRGFIDPETDRAQEELDILGTSEDGSDRGFLEDTSDESEEEGFGYGNTIPTMTKQEIVSVAIHDLKLTHRISRAASYEITSLLESFTEDASCWDYRTTRKWIERMTGIKPVSYDCCLNSCMSYAIYPEKEKCDYCLHPRYKPEGSELKVAFSTHEYIPIIHRIRMWYADQIRSGIMTSYRRKAELQEGYTDYWNSELYNDLKNKKGLFSTITDLGFLLTTDGVQVFKAKTSFSVWPIALVCLNLPPAIRAKRQNFLCAGFIPGPKGPKNLDSFLYPLVKEFEILQNGIIALNGALSKSLRLHDRQFTLKGYICLVGADMIAREKVMRVTGNRSYCYCEFCLVQGVWNRGLYCPISPPTDTPPGAQTRKGSGYPWVQWDRHNLPMRVNSEFRRVAEQIARKGANPKQQSKYGIKGLSILSRLKSIDFPRSFPPDSMHLWFENVIPDLVKHWRGKYRVEVITDALENGSGVDVETSSESGTSEDESDMEEPPAKRRKTNGKAKSRSRKSKSKAKSKNRRKVNKAGKAGGVQKGATKAKEPKVIATDDPYNIPLLAWEEMSREIAGSAPTFPLLFGPLLRNFLEHIHEMTAAEWQLFTFLLAPVYLKGVLPLEDYEEFISLVEGIQISCDYALTGEDIEAMRQRIVKFSEYYEKRYYRGEWARLKACLPVFHQLLHVPQALKWAGPMYVYSQWAMERFCGTLAGMAKSRVSTNRNLSINLAMVEQKNGLVYVLNDAIRTACSSDEDSDGGIRLSNFLTKRLKKQSRLQDLEPRSSASSSSSDNGIDTVSFCGPSKIHKLATYERMCLKAFFLDEEYQDFNIDDADLNKDADSLDIPTYCRSFRSCLFSTMGRGDIYPFKAVSATSQRSNQSRSTSFIRYERHSGNGHVGRRAESNFGEIQFFFCVDLPAECTYARLNIGWNHNASIALKVREKERGVTREAGKEELLLAYIRHFSVVRDGRLLYRENKGVLKVILASDIHELIGLLRKGDREYIVRKDSALFY